MWLAALLRFKHGRIARHRNSQQSEPFICKSVSKDMAILTLSRVRRVIAGSLWLEVLTLETWLWSRTA